VSAFLIFLFLLSTVGEGGEGERVERRDESGSVGGGRDFTAILTKCFEVSQVPRGWSFAGVAVAGILPACVAGVLPACVAGVLPACVAGVDLLPVARGCEERRQVKVGSSGIWSWGVWGGGGRSERGSEGGSNK